MIHQSYKQPFLKKLFFTVLIFLITLFLFPVFSTNAASAPLGAENSCTENVLGSFNGISACVNQNGDLHICKNNFPDTDFLNYIHTTTNNEYLTTSECERVFSIELSPDVSANIEDLHGIEYFTSLKDLRCSNGALTTLNIRNNKNLTILYCNNNALTELDLSHNPMLEILWCNYNQLTHINVSQNKNLKHFVVGGNPLTDGLDISQNTYLEELGCYSNQLTELDLGNNPSLKKLVCTNNFLKHIDVSKNPNLKELFCYNNSFIDLDLSNQQNFCGGLETYNNANVWIFQQLDSKWAINLTKYCSAENLPRIVIPESDQYNYNSATGLLTFTDQPVMFECYYDTLTQYENTQEKVFFISKVNPVVCPHTNTTWYETPPTCIENGMKTKVCTDCSAILEILNTLPASGHTFGNWNQILSPSVAKEGIEERICSKCQLIERRNIPPIGHAPENEFTIDKEPASVPKTGDTSYLGLFTILLLLSGGTIGILKKYKHCF